MHLFIFFFSYILLRNGSAGGEAGVSTPTGRHEGVTFFLSASLSSLQVASCFFQLSTLAEDSCSASTSLALFSLKVCSSVSHFLALVLLQPDYKCKGNIETG